MTAQTSLPQVREQQLLPQVQTRHVRVRHLPLTGAPYVALSSPATPANAPAAAVGGRAPEAQRPHPQEDPQ